MEHLYPSTTHYPSTTYGGVFTHRLLMPAVTAFVMGA